MKESKEKISPGNRQKFLQKNEHLYSVHTVDLLQTTNNLIQLWRNYLMNNSNLYQTL